MSRGDFEEDWYNLFLNPYIDIFGELHKVQVISVEKINEFLYKVRLSTPDKYCEITQKSYWNGVANYEMITFEPTEVICIFAQGTFNLMDRDEVINSSLPKHVKDDLYNIREAHSQYYRDNVYINVKNQRGDFQILHIEPLKHEYEIWLCDRYEISHASVTLDNHK